MQLPSFAALSLVAALPLASAQLNQYAQKAGLKYFGSATDSPGQRERAGYETAYPTYDAIIRRKAEFGQLTPANGMKWLFTEPEPGVFNYTEGEIVASIAAETGQLLRCHALVWHSQLAPWVESTNWTADALRDVITRHITNVAGHWKGRCYAWDVVNEALFDNGTYRDSVFYKVLGPDYIKHAFTVASQVDPSAKLYYNDYNLESPGNKSVAALGIVKMLKDAGIRIDGIGMQAHLHADKHPTIDQHIDVINSYTATGVEVALTELDVRIELPLNSTNLQQQKEAYQGIVGACVQVAGCIGVTVWDFYDTFSWVPAVFPGQGNALLWFDNFTVHPAYYGVIDALKNSTRSNKCKKRRSIEDARSTKLY